MSYSTAIGGTAIDDPPKGQLTETSRLIDSDLAALADRVASLIRRVQPAQPREVAKESPRRPYDDRTLADNLLESSGRVSNLHEMMSTLENLI